MLPKHTKSMKLFCRIDVSGACSGGVRSVGGNDDRSSPHHGYGPDLPHVSHSVSLPGANREDAMVISILRDGAVYFGRDKVPTEQLRSKILGHLREHTVEPRVYIRADARVVPNC
jgi:hypothetical protein